MCLCTEFRHKAQRSDLENDATYRVYFADIAKPADIVWRSHEEESRELCRDEGQRNPVFVGRNIYSLLEGMSCSFGDIRI